MRLKASVHRSMAVTLCARSLQPRWKVTGFLSLPRGVASFPKSLKWAVRAHPVNGSNCSSLLPDDEVNVNAGVNSEVSDFLNNAWGAVNVNNSLVDAHLEAIPGLGTLTARWFTGSDTEDLSRDAYGALGLVALVLWAGNNLSACALEWLDFSASECHSAYF